MTVTCYMLWDLEMRFVTGRSAGDSGRWHYSPAYSLQPYCYSMVTYMSQAPLFMFSSCDHMFSSLSWSLATLSVFPDSVSRSDCASPLLCSRSALQATWPGSLGAREKLATCNQTLRPSPGLARLGAIHDGKKYLKHTFLNGKLHIWNIFMKSISTPALSGNLLNCLVCIQWMSISISRLLPFIQYYSISVLYLWL